MAQKFIGIDQYWRFIAFDECSEMPSFHVQTPYGGREFHCSKGIMKVSGMGMSHYLDRRNGYYD
jgi:hypothetical protein